VDLALLDVMLTYDCNVGCDYCTVSPELRARQLSTEGVVGALRRGRVAGYEAVCFTGGEPTLRRDLPALVRLAHDLGYREKKIQTNGLLLAHAPNLDRLVDAGANLFHVSIQSHDEAVYERIVRRPGTYRLMAAALDLLVARGVPLRADVILTTATYRLLPETVRWLAARGVRRADLWYVSLTDGNRANLHTLPRLADALPWIHDALAAARALGMEVRSLHVPRCVLGADAAHAWDPGSTRVLVVTPDSEFEVKDSKLAGRVRLPACAGCPHGEVCPGVRPDYVAAMGDGEIVAARAALGPAAGAGPG
jgi:MoaA/NifB/PqqE/SkfB family radical SAM enzyme